MGQDKPTGRVLALLELLQSQALLPGPELARRLDVDARTLRRYIVHLSDLGVPVEAQRGRDGGYRLRPGFKLPPMMFTTDEALALGMGLRAARELGLDGILPAIASTQAKLERVMPQGLHRRIADLNEVVTLDTRRHGAGQRQLGPGVKDCLPALSAATRAQQRVQLDYLAGDGESSERAVDPYGLAMRGGAWYLVGFCHLRQDLRTFRLDRIRALQALPASFARPQNFDVQQRLSEAIATLPRNHTVELLIKAELGQAQAWIAPELGQLSTTRGGVRLNAQIDALPAFARELAAWPFAFKIIKPIALRRALAAHAQALLDLAS